MSRIPVVVRPDPIIDELPPEFVRKLRNWAQATAGVSYSFLHYSFTSAYDDMPPDGWGEGDVPLLTGEAADVWQGLSRLHVRERLAVMLFWSNEGRSLRWLARRLGGETGPLSHNTVIARLRKGHDQLREQLLLIRRHRLAVWSALHDQVVAAARS